MTQDGMWQDSGRYEWPLTGAPGSTAAVSLTQEAETTMDPRPYPDRVTEQMLALRCQVVALQARVAELEQGKDGRTL